MKIYKTQEEVNADIKRGVLAIEGDVRFECDISIKASIVVTKGNLTCRDLTCWDLTCRNLDCWNLTCGDLTCGDLTCWDLTCRNLDCWDIDCLNITCWDIKCENLNCGDIKCGDLTCGDLKCWNLTCRDLTCRDINCLNLTCLNLKCRDLSYFALCFAYQSIKCTSYKARREVHQKPICLDGELTIVKKEDDATKEAIKLLESNGYTISK